MLVFAVESRTNFLMFTEHLNKNVRYLRYRMKIAIRKTALRFVAIEVQPHDLIRLALHDRYAIDQRRREIAVALVRRIFNLLREHPDCRAVSHARFGRNETIGWIKRPIVPHVFRCDPARTGMLASISGYNEPRRPAARDRKGAQMRTSNRMSGQR